MQDAQGKSNRHARYGDVQGGSARAISALKHPHICTLYDVGQHEGSGYLVMEFKATFANALVCAHYRPTTDRQRFLVLAPLAGDASKPASVVLNWTAALKQ
jgi:serine/threonine protein kinase